MKLKVNMTVKLSDHTSKAFEETVFSDDGVKRLFFSRLMHLFEGKTKEEAVEKITAFMLGHTAFQFNAEKSNSNSLAAAVDKGNSVTEMDEIERLQKSFIS
jgi:hypothetical protein